LQLHLLVRRQLVLNPDRHPHMQRFDFTFGIENFAELGQRLLFVALIRLHGFVQSFHRILQLPLQLVEARCRPIDLGPHERLLIIGQPQLSLMLHHHIRREDGITERIRWWRRWLRLPLRSGLRWFRLLRRDQHHAYQNGRAENCD